MGVLAVAGCGTPAVVFDRTNLARVQRMGVLTPGFPERPTIAVEPPTQGLLFLAVNGIQEGNRSREFADFLVRANTNPEAEFSRALLACLRQAGVQPTVVPADARRTALVKEYGALYGQALDAILDVVVTRYGYYAPINSAPFKPNLVMQARLVDTRSRNVLMQDTITMVGLAPADPKATPFSFQEYSDMAANPTGAALALQSAMTSAALAICTRLM